MKPERWTDAKIRCATDALVDALRDGCGIIAGIFEDVETEERFLAVSQYLTQRRIKDHATDYTMEWAMFVDACGEDEHVYNMDEEQHFKQGAPMTIDGRKVTLLCGIHYDYAEQPREVMYVGINVERPDAYPFLDIDTLEAFLWDEIGRNTEDMMRMYPDLATSAQDETEKKTDLLSYYERQLDAKEA
jgi:hypothetical protein